MNDNLLYDLKDLRAEIGSLSMASSVNIFTLTYNAMVDKINEIIKKVEDNFYEEK